MPMIRTFLTEAMGQYINNQARDEGQRNKCADYELDAAECLEAYGMWRGERYCKMYMDDYYECIYNRKSTRRFHYMNRERMRQVIQGERSVFNFWGPKVDREAYGGSSGGFRV